MTIEKIKQIRLTIGDKLDPSTQSNYNELIIKQARLELEVFFDKKIIKGKVNYKIGRKHKSVEEVVLDTSYLEILKVSINHLSTEFSLGEHKAPLGRPLSIIIPKIDDVFDLEIEYNTTNRCTALQFLDQSATDSKNAPYLFSQCQAIHARSFFPCFDTPSVKLPYEFQVTSPYQCLMSGRLVSSDKGVYTFKQPIPIPSYLVALASGNLKSGVIGPRSTCYSEAPHLKACIWEFEKDIEDFIKAAESLVFDYEWSKYDALVLPSSFPYGGMENPNITFVTPTLVSGDRSQVRVMAHELAHSWSGNLVTNSSWEHFWLNEGWTVYLERRIIEAVNRRKLGGGSESIEDDQAEKLRNFGAITGLISLKDSLDMVDKKYTKLVLNLTDGDPDDSFSRIPYEKGFNFLFFLEKKLGGKKFFDPFIKYYFSKFRYKSLNTFDFIDTLYEYFSEKGLKETLDSIDWYTWLFEEGMPPEMDYDSSLAEECYILASKWSEQANSGRFQSIFSESKDLSKFDIDQHVFFLQDLASKLDESKNQVEFVNRFLETYPSYKSYKNCEIKFQWNVLIISNGEFTPDSTLVADFAYWLGSIGRMKFVRPGFKILSKYVGKEYAKSVYQKFRSRYHPICQSMVEKDLKIV